LAPGDLRNSGVALEYRAPEQLVGGDAADRTDIYGLGAVLYAMLTGAAPPTAAGRAAGSLWEPPPPVTTLRPEVPAPPEQLLTRAREREPERRPTTMSEVAERLLDLTASVIEAETATVAPFAAPERVLAPLAAPTRKVAPAVGELTSPPPRRE